MRTNSSPASSSTRRIRASRASPRCGALAPTAAASMGWAAPKWSSSSSVHRKREFGGGGPPGSGAAGSSGGGASGSSTGGGGSALAAPRAGIDAKSQLSPPGAATRAQRKLTLIGRRSTTKRKASSCSGPTGRVAARWRRRRALGPSPRTSRASSASKLSTPNNASMAGLASTMRAGGNAIASRALSPSQSAGPSRGSKAAVVRSGERTASSAGVDGGEWVKVGAREWRKDRRGWRPIGPTTRALKLAKA